MVETEAASGCDGFISHETVAGLGWIVGAVRFVGRSKRRSWDTLPQPTEYLSLEEGAWSKGPLGHQGRNSDRQDRGPCPSSGKQQL